MRTTLQYKVCGITSTEQAHALDELGVHYIGFIFYPHSERYVLSKMSLDEISNFTPKNAKKVGVFVNEALEKLLQIASVAGLDCIQLHGDETPEYGAAISERFELIKVFRVGDKMPELAPFENVANYYLFDTDSKLYGGTGVHFNWELLKGNTIGKPFFLSGGIGPNDLGGIEVLKQTIAGKDLLAVDMNSQFEDSPGIKNIEQIKTFIYEIV